MKVSFPSVSRSSSTGSVKGKASGCYSIMQRSSYLHIENLLTKSLLPCTFACQTKGQLNCYSERCSRDRSVISFSSYFLYGFVLASRRSGSFGISLCFKLQLEYPVVFIHAVESFDSCFQTTAVHYQVLWGGRGGRTVLNMSKLQKKEIWGGGPGPILDWQLVHSIM